MSVAPGPMHYFAAIVNVVFWGTIFALGAIAVRRSRSALLLLAGRCAFAGALSIALIGIITVMTRGNLRARIIATTVALLVPLASLIVARLRALAVAALIAVSPFILVTFSRALQRSWTFDPSSFANQPAARPLNPSRLPQEGVVWTIFDEWDQRLTFDARDPGLRLPELDRFRRESIYASDAHPPGTDTIISMPALITGRPLSDVSEAGPADLLLKLGEANRTVSWKELPSVFSMARKAGFNTTLIGFYHPYCRVLGSALTQCVWWPFDRSWDYAKKDVLHLAEAEAKAVLETPSRSPFGLSGMAALQKQIYDEALNRAKRVVSGKSMGLVLLHFPVPHTPPFYRRPSAGIRVPILDNVLFSAHQAYLDSLELVDHTVGELRRSMERAGTWRNTAVLLSSDHPYRRTQYLPGNKMDPRVPWLLKLPEQSEGLVYSRHLETITTRDLLLAILTGELKTPAAVTGWLDHWKTP